jgi:hypothetical protein
MMKTQRKSALLLLSAMALGWLGITDLPIAAARGNKAACPFSMRQKAEAQATAAKAERSEPVVQLEASIKGPDGVLAPGTYNTHPLLGLEGFTELTLSKDGRVVTRFPLTPAQSQPTPITEGSGFPAITTKAKLTDDRKAVVFTVYEGDDRYESAPFPVTETTEAR